MDAVKITAIDTTVDNNNRLYRRITPSSLPRLWLFLKARNLRAKQGNEPPKEKYY